MSSLTLHGVDILIPRPPGLVSLKMGCVLPMHEANVTLIGTEVQCPVQWMAALQVVRTSELFCKTIQKAVK